MSRSTLACALGAGLVAAAGVVDRRVGLALAAALLLVLAAAMGAAGRRACPRLGALAAGLAVQPAVRDAGWVVAVAVVAALLTAAAAAAPPGRWTDLRRALVAPLRWLSGTRLVATALIAAAPRPGERPLVPLLRGAALALVVCATFAALLVSADRAFSDLADSIVAVEVAPGALAARAAVGLLFVALAGALARAGRAPHVGPQRRPAAPGRTELRMTLGSLVALFAAFVAVQLRVLFGGAGYVARTTGLGYGDYARQGFVQLLVVAVLTLAVVAVGARRPDHVVRGLLGALCLLTVVMLTSAHHRLGLVEDAYGSTRVRYGGHAIVYALAAAFTLAAVAGASRRAARHAPRAAAALGAAAALAFCLSNPDARIAERAVARAAAGGDVDAAYLSGLSADALPALERLPVAERRRVVPSLRSRLVRPDGVAGFNLARRAAR